MRRFLLSICLLAAAHLAVAQWNAPVRRMSDCFGRHDCGMAATAAKQQYRHRLTEFRTSDGYMFSYFSFNESNQLVAVKDSVRDEYCVVDSLFYDERGQLVRLSGWQLFRGEWINVYYVDYGYDDGGRMVSRTNYNNFDGVWELGGVYNYSYDGSGNRVLSELTMGGVVYQRVEYEYDETGNVLSELWYSYAGSGLVPSEKLTTVYEHGRKAVEYDSISEDGVRWMNNGYYSYIYNEGGDCVEFHHYDASNREVERSVFAINQELRLSETLIPSHPELSRPRMFDNAHAYDSEQWFSLDVDHVLQHVCDYIYVYEPLSEIESAPAGAVLTAYPNPAHDYIYIKGWEAPACTVQVVDVSGRVVFSRNDVPMTQPFDIRSLPAGTYLLHLSAGQTTSIIPFVKK